MNLYSKNKFPSADEAFSFHSGLMLRLADRGFKSIDLFRFIDEDLNLKHCISCTKYLGIIIPNKSKINKFQDITKLF